MSRSSQHHQHSQLLISSDKLLNHLKVVIATDLPSNQRPLTTTSLQTQQESVEDRTAASLLLGQRVPNHIASRQVATPVLSPSITIRQQSSAQLSHIFFLMHRHREEDSLRATTPRPSAKTPFMDSRAAADGGRGSSIWASMHPSESNILMSAHSGNASRPLNVAASGRI